MNAFAFLWIVVKLVHRHPAGSDLLRLETAIALV